MTESTNKSFASYVFLCLRVKFLKVGNTKNVSFKKKHCQSFYKTFHIFFLYTIAQMLHGMYLEDINLKVFERNDSSVPSP